MSRVILRICAQKQREKTLRLVFIFQREVNKLVEALKDVNRCCLPIFCTYGELGRFTSKIGDFQKAEKSLQTAFIEL